MRFRVTKVPPNGEVRDVRICRRGRGSLSDSAARLNEFVYCPRLFHLMYVQEQFRESSDTVEGTLAHRKRLSKTKAGSRPEEDGEAAVPWPADVVRAMTLSSDSLGIVGKFDVILEEATGLIPVEVKRGPAPDGTSPFRVGPYELKGIAWGNDQVQLAGQIALLREAGHPCSMGRLYYRKTRTLWKSPGNRPSLRPYGG